MESKYGGLRVRGLGAKQRKQIQFTDSKITSFLAVSPFTFGELWSISRIHRNTLKRRLEYLVSRGIVLKHKYAIPYKHQFYGFMFKYPLLCNTPLYGHTYYLLNLSNKDVQQIISYYYDSPTGDHFQYVYNFDTNLSTISSIETDLDKFLEMTNWIRSGTFEKHLKFMSDTERKEYTKIIFKNGIFLSRRVRESDLTLVKKREKEHITIRKKQIKQVIYVAHFFIMNGFSERDVLIRCSREETLITDKENERFSLLHLPMMNYTVLWKMMNEIDLWDI